VETRFGALGDAVLPEEELRRAEVAAAFGAAFLVVFRPAGLAFFAAPNFFPALLFGKRLAIVVVSFGARFEAR